MAENVEQKNMRSLEETVTALAAVQLELTGNLNTRDKSKLEGMEAMAEFILNDETDSSKEVLNLVLRGRRRFEEALRIVRGFSPLQPDPGLSNLNVSEVPD